MTKSITAAAFLSLFLFSSVSYADEAKPDFATDKATGNWGGQRDRLLAKGFSFDIDYKGEAWRNLSGGVQKGNRALDDLDVKMTIDGEKALNLEGTTFFVYFLNNNGGRPNDLAGTNGGISNIEVPTRSFKLYEAWVQKETRGGAFSILAGLHDLNSEFYVTDTSGLFLNPTYGIGTEMAATGDNGPSIFPYTGLALRFALKPTDSTYLQAAVFDGVPGDTDHPRGTHIDLSGSDGALLVAEGGIQSDDLGHFGIGAWHYTSKRPEQADPTAESHQQGLYFLADRSVYKEDGKDVSTFARVGFADGKVGQFRSNWSTGFVFSGFVSPRPDDQFGFAATRAVNSSNFRTANPGAEHAETQFELTYNAQLTPWFSLQPDLQYTINPGTDSSLKNAWTGGLRMTVNF